MNSNLMPFVYLLAVLLLIVLAMIAWRRKVASQEDSVIHVSESAGVAEHQAAVAEKLEHIDRWGKTLTIITVVYGVVVAAAWLYQGWVGSNIPVR